MNKIFIEKISLQNFGGVARGEYNFADDANTIESASGTGKSSAYLAYLWALGFNVSTWEPMLDGYRLHKAKTEVVINLNVGGIKYTLSKTNAPKYKINKFTGEEEYSGTGYEYYLDGQKLNAGDYQNKVAEIFGVDYFTLELVSVIDLFNTEDGNRWNKNERRKYLFKLFDLENKIKELGQEKEFECLKEYIEKGKDELEINQILNTIKTNIEKELNSNQVLLEDKQKELGEYNAIDFNALENQKLKLNAEIERLTNEQQEAGKNTIIVEKNEQLAKLKNDLFQVQNKNSAVELDYNRKVNTLTRDLESIEQDIKFCEEKITRLSNELEDLDIEKQTIEEETFDKAKAVCPTCKQNLPTGKVNELIANFENDKEKRLSNIANKHENSTVEQRNTQNRANTLSERKQAILGQLNELKGNIPTEEDTSEIEKQIADLQTEIANIDQTNTTKVIRDKITELKIDYENVIRELSKKDNIEKITNRINDIKARDRELAIQDSERIAKKNALQKYTARKVGMVNDEVNKNFENVSYLFYHFLSASASKEYENICTVAMNGVDYDSMSSGQKVKANLYTNNSLRKILGLNIPQFVDDVVLSDLQNDEKDWQTIYLLTNNNKKLNLTLVKDIYTLEDCDVRK